MTIQRGVRDIILTAWLIAQSSFAADETNQAPVEVVFVNAIFRNGERFPQNEVDGLEYYPNDPFTNYTQYAPYGPGDLTNDGKMKSYKLGELLRKRYNDYFGPDYVANSIYARSTRYERTEMSLQLVLAGMYPPSSRQHWHPSLHWQPIPVVAVPDSNRDLLLTPLMSCKLYFDEVLKVMKLPEVQAKSAESLVVYDHLSKQTGKKIRTSWDLYLLYKSLTALTRLNQTLPGWTKNIYPQYLEQATFQQYQIFNYNRKMIQLNGGILLHKFITDLENALSMKPKMMKRKIHLYSAHDTNIMAMLYAMKLFKPVTIPAFGSMLVMEATQHLGQHYIKMLFYDGIGSDFELLKFDGCPNPCNYKDFIKLISENLPTDLNLKCKT